MAFNWGKVARNIAGAITTPIIRETFKDLDGTDQRQEYAIDRLENENLNLKARVARIEDLLNDSISTSNRGVLDGREG